MWNVELPPANWYTRQSPDLEALIREVADQKVVAIDTETTGLVTWKDIPLFWSMSWGERRVCLPADTLPLFQDVFEDPAKDWVFANAKYDMHILANVGIDIKGRCVDTQVMHALLYEEKPHGLKDMAGQILGWKWMDFFDTFKRLKDESIGSMLLRFSRENLAALVEYASNDAYGTMKIYEKLKDELQGEVTHSLWPDWINTLWDLFDKVEVKFTRVLWTCERNGIKVNFDYLEGIESHVLQVRNDVEKKIAKLAGRLINPNSDHDLRDYFFNHRGMQPLRLTPGGKSGKRQGAVDKAFLQHAAEMGEPMAELCLEHSALGTVINTYIHGWKERADPAGRLHTRFNQDVARCMPAGELVLTNHGYIPVEQVRVGDLVLAHTGVPRPVVETSTHTPRPIYRVTLSNGLTLRTTGNHPYRVGDDWVQADALRPGDVVTVHSEPEVWRPIQNWAPYEVSSWGRVRNSVTGVVRVLHAKDSYGHLKVCLARNGAQKRGPDRKDLGIQRLVLEAFVGTSLESVRHLNGIPWDNTTRNLTYGTAKENTGDARRHGTLGTRRTLTNTEVAEIRAAELAGQPPSVTSRLSFAIAEEIRLREETNAQLAQEYGVSYQSIDNIRKRRTWTQPPLPGARTADELAKQYGVSAGYIREIRNEKARPDNESEGARATFYLAHVVSVTIEAEETTYGLTVDVDSSHVTAGIVTHNSGRLSSSDPNLQNVKRVSEDPFKLRSAFVAPPGKKLIVGDYEQLEMRLLAAATVDPVTCPQGERDMIRIFEEGKDIHMGNASLVFKVPYEDIDNAKKIEKQIKEGKLQDSDMTDYQHQCLFYRQAAKAIGFGLNYGMKENKLARQINKTVEEAKVIIAAYMNTYPAVASFYQIAIEQTRRCGFAFTVMGRRRYLPEITSANSMDRWKAERQAGNTSIQGSAADACKMAMILCHEANLDKRFGASMLLQVHDELVFECPEESAVEAKKEIKEWMEHPFPDDLAVALEVAISIGANWAEAK